MPIGFPLIHYGFQSSASYQPAPAQAGPQTLNMLPGNPGPKYEVLGVHGFGTFADSAIHSTIQLPAALQTVTASPAQISAQLTGSVTIFLQDTSTGDYYAIPDPLGGAITFYWRKNEQWVLSSSLPDLVAFLADHGVALRKSVGYTAALAVVGNGGLYDSPFEGVFALPQFSYARCTREGHLSVEPTETQSRFFDSAPFTETAYWENVESAADAILRNVTAYSSMPSTNRIAHLTGGMDSRTVVAALTKLDSVDNFALYAGGDPRSADVAIARQIAGELGMPITQFSGVRSAVAPSSPEITAQWAMHETGGVLAGPSHAGLQRGADTLVLSGGYGELLRGFYVSAYQDMGPHSPQVSATRNALLGTGAPTNEGDSSASIFSASLIGRAEGVASSLHDEASSLGLRSDAVPDYTYLRVRNRYYVGEITRSLSPYVLRADPMYNAEVMRLAFQMPRALKLDNFLQLDLMGALNPLLARLPFDTPRVTNNYLQQRNNFRPASFSPSKHPVSKYYISEVPYRSKNGHRSPSPQALELARKLGLPSLTVASSEAYRKALIEIRRDMLDAADLKEAFNVPVLDQLLEKPAKWRPQFRLMRSLYNALAWYVS